VDKYLLLNHLAVSLNPSSIVNGGTHPSSRLIFELSTVNDPVNRFTAPLLPVNFPTSFMRETGTGNSRAGTPSAEAVLRTSSGVETSSPSRTK